MPPSQSERTSFEYVTDEKQRSPDHVEDYSNVTVMDGIHVLGLSPEDADFYHNFTPEQRKTVLHKVTPILLSHYGRIINAYQVDIRLVPMLAVLYLISHLDRANIGNAKIAGLTKDLGLTGIQYNIALSLFFIPYVLLEVPSNMLLKNFKRPSVYLGILIICWGIIMTLTGIVQNFAGLLVVRILLGVFEAGFFPGAVYLCSFWYMPKHLATRLAVFYCASALSGAFSGLLAAGIAKMSGVGGLEGWRWIFILEGIATVVLGVLCFFFLINSPKLSGKWLNQDEIRFLELQHFIKDGGQFQEERKSTSWKDITAVLGNWRMYLLAYILLAQSACSYGTKFTLPTITKANIGPGFFAIILTTMGIYPTHPATTSWTMNNLAPSNRRAIGSAFNICVGNIGGIIGSYMYIDKEYPTYPTGFGLSLAFGGSAFVAAVILELSFMWANKKNAAMSDVDIRSKYTDEQLLDMGDKSPLFKYTL
ncbi:uncharacterized protein N7477_006239 [Penicillium maclennaniae]|uniref:uncharacterized protein n=1 Tax=Penicillium maclennaniae TaxID=1343394 RepID=UPI00254040F2|nr:uncharacterized protein N7477_006239 [Penicillium maclennaniae]KAJ5667669.1 hypothetical protein N7477_006239 [Penicillium maclennaniae]